MNETYSFRVFRGDETRQLALKVTGAFPADPSMWYWEPDNYEGAILFSRGFATREEAIYAAETGHT